MGPIQFRSDQHEIVEGPPVVGYLRRELNDPLIFMYKHHRTGNFMVAAWVDSPGGRMLELACAGKTPVLHEAAVRGIMLMKRGNPEGERNKRESRQALRFMEQRANAADEEVMADGFDAMKFLNRRRAHKAKHHVVPAGFG
jgi:hypothetical protein